MHNVIRSIRDRARGYNSRIGLPEVDCERVMQAAVTARQQNLAQIVLIGSPDIVAEQETKLGLDLQSFEIMDPLDENVRQQCAQTYYEARQGKTTEEEAYQQVADPLYCCAALLKQCTIDGSVAGRVHTSSDVLRSLIRTVGPKDGIQTISSCFIMATRAIERGHQGALIFADAGTVIRPTVQQLADIAIVTAESTELYLETEPRVAMLSFSTKGSASHEEVDRVVAATDIVRNRYPDLLIEGELQGDAALVPEVAAEKCPRDRLQGTANTLIFPDLNAGNISYKLVQRLGGARAYGPLVQGLAKPGMDLSRGATAQDVTTVIAVAALRAGAGT